MADRPDRRWPALAGCCWLLCAAVVLAGCTGGSASGSAKRVSSSAIVVLQLNLCNSGIAPCYTGRSVAAAAAVIRARRPDVVTLNEICRADLPILEHAMAGARTSAFEAARDPVTGKALRCVNGQQYGIGVLARANSANSVTRTYRGRYPMQDSSEPEARVWLCVHAQIYACTTHTSSTSPQVALAQCRYFMTVAVPSVLRRGGTDTVVLGADLNLVAGAGPGPRSCVPHGYRRVDDGSRQDVISSADFVVRAHSTVDMHGSTDHPGLLVELVPEK